MVNSKNLFFLALAIAFLPASHRSAVAENDFPVFGRDTVLVWKIQNPSSASEFVVRIADFYPDRFLEWETDNKQGTVFIPSREIEKARNFIYRSLFVPGVDKKSKNATTLWLSRGVFRELKDKSRAKCRLDGVGGSFALLGKGHMSVEINGHMEELPVISVSDNRGSELLFLDNEENPLMARQKIRVFSQTLISITTDRSNSLRWIKGKKTGGHPH